MKKSLFMPKRFLTKVKRSFKQKLSKKKDRVEFDDDIKSGRVI